MTYFVGTTIQSTGHEVAKLQTELLLSLDYYSWWTAEVKTKDVL